ncbi:VanZ family protein [Tepidanaerobacter sp. EBM-49]|uniref:VanZ family protein n=1 Tax=Tepidanaerobacter sp. EBM-49 TaxID=1918504 RepID=UPI000A8BFCC1|nr:VanZ family protein [Tepidanaerobacter sp. EBM-49]
MNYTVTENRKMKIGIRILFCIYFIFLIKVILFKYPINIAISALKAGEIPPLAVRLESANFIPTKTIFRFVVISKNLRVSAENLLGNIAIFAPLGFLLPVILKRKIHSLKSVVTASFFVSLAMETAQLLFNLGIFDVDDILLNMLGAILGYAFYRLIKH